MQTMDLEQNTLDWLRWRSRGIGASDAGIILGVSPWFTRRQLMNRKVDEIRDLDNSGRKPRAKKQADNGAMARGRRLEPKIRQMYEDMTGIAAQPVCAIHKDLDWMRASLDGWDDNLKLILEIKAPNIDDHKLALAGNVPMKYQPQVQHQMVVAQTDKLHYVSFSDNKRISTLDRLAIVTVRPSKQLQKKIIDEETRFWDELQEELQKPTNL